MSHPNPVIAEILRGRMVESLHRGAFVVMTKAGEIVHSSGDVKKPIFPRSAIKAFQCVPLIERGAAEAFTLNDEEIALCCASHTGEADHVRVATSILQKAGLTEDAYACGVSWPERMDDRAALIRAGEVPRSIHNNCSGKHAGMLALAKHLGAPLASYVDRNHAVQLAVADALDRYCDARTRDAVCGIDGCSVPTWAIPLENLAGGFAALFSEGNATGKRIAAAVRAFPHMVAGTGKFDTRIMQAVPRLFIKYGAEAVYCGSIPHAGLGFALKIDDGAARAAEAAIAGMLAKLDCWTAEEQHSLQQFSHTALHNWRKMEVGATRANF
jgi:L-asparaginase II